MTPHSTRSPDQPLQVLHIGPRPDYGRGGGVDAAAWPLLTAQVAEGTDVALLVLGDLDEAARAEAARIGVAITAAPEGRLETLSADGARAIKRLRPDIIHLHSVFIPAHAQIARIVRSSGIPYIVTPHGGLNLWRGRLKKALYGAMVEKPYFRGAQTILVLTERERQVVQEWLGGRNSPPPCLEVPNSIRPLSPETQLWTLPDRPQLVYLGRFDVVKKGLDRLVEIAKLMPDVEVHAYGSAARSELAQFRQLCRRGLPANMSFRAPVYGDEKTAAYTSATIYVQPSRDEGFGMSVAEAMRLAVPVAVSGGCDLAATVARDGLGMLLPDDPVHAARDLASALADPARLRQWSQAGREWTIQALSPKVVAQRTIAVYEELLSGAAPRRQ